jgi:hypothetical protein
MAAYVVFVYGCAQMYLPSLLITQTNIRTKTRTTAAMTARAAKTTNLIATKAHSQQQQQHDD